MEMPAKSPEKEKKRRIRKVKMGGEEFEVEV